MTSTTSSTPAITSARDGGTADPGHAADSVDPVDPVDPADPADPADPTEPSILRQPRAVWAVAFACVIAFMGIGLVDPILKPIAEDLDASPSQVSLLFTSYMAVTGLAMLVTGVISSRIGPKRTLLGGLALIVVFSALAGSSSTINEIDTPRPRPARPSSADASGVATPKQSTGRLVSSPAVLALIPRSARMGSSTADTATIGPRRFSASTTMARTSSAAGVPARVGAPESRGGVGAVTWSQCTYARSR